MRALITLSILTAAASVDLLAAEDEEDAIALIKSASFDVKKVEEKEVRWHNHVCPAKFAQPSPAKRVKLLLQDLLT